MWVFTVKSYKDMEAKETSSNFQHVHELVQKLFGQHMHVRSFTRITVIVTTPDQMEFKATANTKNEAKELLAEQIKTHYNDMCKIQQN
jgi:hypothetical protein